jgi:hypothetical protein
VVHGHPEIQGRVGRLPADPALALEHPGYGDDLGRFIAKNTRYAPLDAGRVAADLRPPVWPYLVRRPLGEFTGRYIRCQAWRHGMVGLVWSLLMAHYQLLVGIHYWALSRQGQPEALDPSALRRSVRWQVIREGLKWLRR